MITESVKNWNTKLSAGTTLETWKLREGFMKVTLCPHRWSKRQLDERKTGKGIHWKDKKDLKVKVQWFKYGIGS